MSRFLLLALLTGCAAPTASTVAARHGEETTATVGTTPTVTHSPRVAPRVSPSAASRTRPFTGLTASGPGRTLTSTAYCETGLMANGHRTRRGAVAANRYPLGTVLRVTDSPYGPSTFTVEDRIGHGSDLDFALPGDCDGARGWGRRQVHVEVLT